MEVVIEETFFISFFLTFLILHIVSLILKMKLRFAVFSSIFSGLVCLAEPLYILTFYLKAFLILACGTIILLISFNFTSIKQFLLTFTVTVITTFLFGGGCFALKELIGDYPTYIVAVVGLGVFIATKILIKVVNHHRRVRKFTYNLVLKDGDKEIKEEGYLDSGNVLYDTITKKPIVLINFEVFSRLYENISRANLLTRDCVLSSIKNGHYIKINSIGKGTSILVFTVDKLKVEEGEKEFKNVCLGLSFSGFEKSFGKNVLLHSEFC